MNEKNFFITCRAVGGMCSASNKEVHFHHVNIPDARLDTSEDSVVAGAIPCPCPRPLARVNTRACTFELLLLPAGSTTGGLTTAKKQGA